METRYYGRNRNSVAYGKCFDIAGSHISGIEYKIYGLCGSYL